MEEIQVVLLNILALLLLFITLQPPIAENSYPLQQRLFPNFRESAFRGRDVFSLISGQAFLFWRNTGETPGSFLRLATVIVPSLLHLTIYGRPRVRQRHQKLNFINQILLVLMWLRKYPHVDSLALWFDIDPSSVVRIVYKILPELWRYFHNQIVWPNLLEWNNVMGNWPEFPSVVDTIDTTPHEIYRPLTEPQRPFYSGHRHYHCFNTQLVMDNRGHIRILQAGFLGSMHDAVSFRLMEPIGPGRNLDLPPNAKLLADKAYPDGSALITPVRANQIPLLNNRERRRARRFNRVLSKRRFKVEHIFKEMKTYKAISQIWRHPRWLLPVCVELAAFLAERRVRLFKGYKYSSRGQPILKTEHLKHSFQKCCFFIF